MKTPTAFLMVAVIGSSLAGFHAHGQIFTDDFDNGVLQNATSFPSGNPVGFWTYSANSNIAATEAVGGPAVLNASAATGTNTQTSTLQSNVHSAFDFFSNSLTMSGDVSVATDSTTQLNGNGGRFMISSNVANPGAVDDGLILQLNVGETSGVNSFFILKRINGSQTTPISTTDIGGIAEGFSLTMDDTNFSLYFNLVGGGVSSTYTQAHGFTTTNWGTSGSSLLLQAFRGTGSDEGSLTSFTLNSLEVVPEPGTLGLVSITCCGLGVLVMRRRRA
jgi:hypothetical protein